MPLGNREGENARNRVRRPAWAWNLRFAVYKSTFQHVFLRDAGSGENCCCQEVRLPEMQPLLYFVRWCFEENPGTQNIRKKDKK